MKKLLLAIMTLGVLFSASSLLLPAPAFAAPLQSTTDCAVSGNGQLNANNCKIVKYIQLAMQILSTAVGIVIVIMVAISGFQYTLSKDNPQQTSSAKQHIRDAIFALIIYIFAIAFLNWIVPGGIIG